MLEGKKREFRLAHSGEWQQVAKIDKERADSAAFVQMLRQAIEDQRCYVVTSGEEIAAFGILHYHFFNSGFLELLIVASRFRRQGIGRMLLNALPGVCRTEKLFTSTNLSNYPMQSLLQACGWRRCGYIDELDPGDPELVYYYERATKPHQEVPFPPSAPDAAAPV